MTSDLITYAALSDHVYLRHVDDQQIDLNAFGITGGNLAEVPLEDENQGFYAESYLHDGKVVVAFRGTDGSRFTSMTTDWLNGNIPLALNSWEADQWDAAQRYVEGLKENPDYQDIEFVFTGHSLGGGLAAAHKRAGMRLLTTSSTACRLSAGGQ